MRVPISFTNKVTQPTAKWNIKEICARHNPFATDSLDRLPPHLRGQINMFRDHITIKENYNLFVSLQLIYYSTYKYFLTIDSIYNLFVGIIFFFNFFVPSFILHPTNRQQCLAGLIVNEPYQRKHSRIIWNIKQFCEVWRERKNGDPPKNSSSTSDQSTPQNLWPSLHRSMQISSESPRSLSFFKPLFMGRWSRYFCTTKQCISPACISRYS